MHRSAVLGDIKHSTKFLLKVLSRVITHFLGQAAEETFDDLLPLPIICVIAKNVIATVVRSGPVQPAPRSWYIVAADSQDVSRSRGDRGSNLTPELSRSK